MGKPVKMMNSLRALCAILPLAVLAGCGGPSEADVAKLYSGVVANPKIENLKCVESVGEAGYTCVYWMNGIQGRKSFVKSGNGWRAL